MTPCVFSLLESADNSNPLLIPERQFLADLLDFRWLSIQTRPNGLSQGIRSGQINSSLGMKYTSFSFSPKLHKFIKNEYFELLFFAFANW